MIFIETPLFGAYIIESEPSTDERGVFARTFCSNEFHKIGFSSQIVQINYSFTKKQGTVRGIHYQLPPACEVKLVRCIQGKVFDVIVDLRMGSPTLMRWFGYELSEDKIQTVLIPEGCAHGFQSLTNNTALIYHHTAFYSPEYERGMRFDDPSININWPLQVSNISEKDQKYPLSEKRFMGIAV